MGNVQPSEGSERNTVRGDITPGKQDIYQNLKYS